MSNSVKLFHGDCLEILPQLTDDGVCVDLVLTDLPYGTTACKWDCIIPFNVMWDIIHGVVDSRTPIVLFGTEPFSSKLRLSNIYEYKYDLIWHKNSTGDFALYKTCVS